MTSWTSDTVIQPFVEIKPRQCKAKNNFLVLVNRDQMCYCCAFLIDQDSTKRAGGRKAQDSGKSSVKAHVAIRCIYH